MTPAVAVRGKGLSMLNKNSKPRRGWKAGVEETIKSQPNSQQATQEFTSMSMNPFMNTFGSKAWPIAEVPKQFQFPNTGMRYNI